MPIRPAGRRPPPTFTEVDPKHTSRSFRQEVQRALDCLRTSRSAIGRATYREIASGRVKVDLLTDLTRADFQRVRKELRSAGVRLAPSAFSRLHDEQLGASRAIREVIDGYMWDDRVYVARGMSPKSLAATLVHEVNHVINRSEEHYRSPRAALIEEYRAFYVQALFRGEKMTPAKCRALKSRVIRDYKLAPLTPDAVPDLPPGKLLPTARR